MASIAMLNNQRVYVIWTFPEMGVPPNHTFLFGVFHFKPTSYWGIPIYGNPHMLYIQFSYVNIKPF
jgi:hypothetical protein